MEKAKNLPDFSFERKLWKKGVRIVGGADEVGRGSFAGPVVAGVVVFPNSLQGTILQGVGKIVVNDSKKLTARQREIADKWIRENALTIGIGQGSVSRINRLGIKKATEIAFRKATGEANKILKYKDIKIFGLGNSSLSYKSSLNISLSKYSMVQHLLLDAFFVPYVKNLSIGRRKKYEHKKGSKIRVGTNQTAIIHGDEKSFSIAAASIIAKVYRDRIMSALGQKNKYKKYKWDKNKGYGTNEHQLAIIKFGLTRHHRKVFVKTFIDSFSVRGQSDA